MYLLVQLRLDKLYSFCVCLFSLIAFRPDCEDYDSQGQSTMFISLYSHPLDLQDEKRTIINGEINNDRRISVLDFKCRIIVDDLYVFKY